MRRSLAILAPSAAALQRPTRAWQRSFHAHALATSAGARRARSLSLTAAAGAVAAAAAATDDTTECKSGQRVRVVSYNVGALRGIKSSFSSELEP